MNNYIKILFETQGPCPGVDPEVVNREPTREEVRILSEHYKIDLNQMMQPEFFLRGDTFQDTLDRMDRLIEELQ